MLSEIYTDIEKDPAFAHLRTPGIRIVEGYSAGESSEIMFIGEAPGEEENRTGVPFSGNAGEKFHELLDSIELFDFFVTNVLKYRPPGNRDPYPSEVRAAKPYLLREIQAVRPRLVVTLGKIATGVFFSMDKFRAVRGKVFMKRGVRILPLYHPAFACYNEGKPEELTVIREFSLIRSVYDSGASA